MRVRPIKAIRLMLAVTQEEFADALQVHQTNVSHYERGQTVPPSVAGRLIEYAAGFGLRLSYGMVYGAETLPHWTREGVKG